MAIFAHLARCASILPTDASALERAISALESEVTSLESSSVPWEHRLPWFTGAVALGVALEFWVLWHDRREDMHAWGRGVICWPPGRPSLKKYIVEMLSILLVTGGIIAELWAGVEITKINGQLRAESAALRTKSDQLVALLNVKTGDAQQAAGEANDRASKNERVSEAERKARLELEENIAPRALTEGQEKDIASRLWVFRKQLSSVWYNATDVEGSLFAKDIAKALGDAKWAVTQPSSFVDFPSSGSGPLETGVIVGYSSNFKRSKEAAEAVASELGSLGFDVITRSNGVRSDSFVPITVAFRPRGPQGEAKLRAEAENKQKARATASH